MSPTNHVKPGLPPGFVTVRSILEENHRKGSFVDVVGLVIDSLVPRATGGSDWKCTIKFTDDSVKDGNFLEFHYFGEQSQMPSFRSGDVLVLKHLKIQMREFEAPSLIKNWGSSIYLFTAQEIPHPPADATSALAFTFSKPTGAYFEKDFTGKKEPTGKKAPQLSKAELEYVSKLYHTTDKCSVPTVQEFETLQIQSGNYDKFSELKDVEHGKFYDLIVEVVKEPYDSVGMMSMWVSDYTENDTFYKHSFKGGNIVKGQDADRYEHTSKFPAEKSPGEWGGPFGKRSMQITLFDNHVAVIRDEKIGKGAWISLKNVQVKPGNNGQNTEGFLRGDRNSKFESRIRISRFDLHEDPELLDSRLKIAIKRKRDYEEQRKSQLREIQEARNAGQKRKFAVLSDVKPQQNSRARRTKKRRTGIGRIEQNSHQQGRMVQRAETTVPLNPQVKCENQTKENSMISEVIEQVFQRLNDDDGDEIELPLPFTNQNYRCNVRVTNFRPSSLEDFTRGRKKIDFDVLSDNGESPGSSDSEGYDDSMTANVTADLKWEWRFWLELEDATCENAERVWVVLDNQSAELLTSLDACDLRRNPEILGKLRQKMFILWGNLEEEKSSHRSQTPRSGDDVRLDSSDDETVGMKISNQPFPCCIKQYGIKVLEQDAGKATAGNNLRWERMFGMYGTKVSGA